MSLAIKKAIIMTAEYYGRQLSETVLLMYAEDLHDLHAGECIAAYGRYRRNPANKTFPLPAQIRELVAPEQFVAVETQAREIASRIMGAIPKFGWANAKEAQAYIGPQGWALVDRSGGWRYLCENTNARQVPTMLAQFRDQLEGSLRYSVGAIEQSIQAVPSREARGLESASDVIMRMLPKPSDTEEGA